MKISLFKHNIWLIAYEVFTYFTWCLSYSFFLFSMKMFLKSSHGRHVYLPFPCTLEGSFLKSGRLNDYRDPVSSPLSTIFLPLKFKWKTRWILLIIPNPPTKKLGLLSTLCSADDYAAVSLASHFLVYIIPDRKLILQIPVHMEIPSLRWTN